MEELLEESRKGFSIIASKSEANATLLDNPKYLDIITDRSPAAFDDPEFDQEMIKKGLVAVVGAQSAGLI